MLKKKQVSGKKQPTTNLHTASELNKKNKPFPVVAIGSSAGGLEAATVLFRNLPSTTGMAFIYVQHLSPDHKSMLTPILSKITGMKVQEIEDMEHMAPNNVYVIPNDRGIKVTDGHIKLIPRSGGGAAVSIDVLFSSLALTHKENVVGIVLSGNAHDGTEGLKAIKEAGGVTFAQDGTAQAKSMPQSAIASGAVDFILSPKAIALELIRLAKTGLTKHRIKKAVTPRHVEPEEGIVADNDPNLRAILDTLQKDIHVDFSLYKMATIKRRINHRMLQCGIKTIKEYAKYLLKKNEEVALLYKDLLINITSFFRDAETFRYLKSSILPKLLKGKTRNEQLRIWVPACSTGEEAYSIAMLLTELQEKKTKKISVQIFATDLSDRAIRDARLGEYSENELRAISKKRSERFFTKTGHTYRVVKELRDMCVFAPHNILYDPPFSRIDLISCRNLLIYFDAAAQKKALLNMHFSLSDGGFLLLGKSETVGTSSLLFSQQDSKVKIYTRKKSTDMRRAPDLIPRFPAKLTAGKNVKPLKKNSLVTSSELDNAIDATLLSFYMPACVIINKSMEIIKFRGLTSLYLAHPSGNASLNILKMTRPEFVFELRNAIQEVIKTNTPVSKSGIRLNPGIHDLLSHVVSIEVRPLAIEWGEPLFLIVFNMQAMEKQSEKDDTSKNSLPPKDLRMKRQIEELQKASAEMVSVIESQDRAYEDLQAANEEIISASEEFQTLNEELETSREEIEASNEELLTTNQELQMRNEQLAESYNFSEAVAETMHEPMLILDKHLRIKSANNAFYKKFHVMKTGTEGMLLFELGNHQWDIPSLRQLLENIIQKNVSFYDHEITHAFPEIGKKTMLLNARRILQKTQNEQLILLTFIDTTALIEKRKADNKGLEDVINERTAALEQSVKTVKQKNMFLEKANRELEAFTFISNHDLQEPVRKIKMFTSCLIEEENKNLSAMGKEYLNKVQRITGQMQLLIDDLLIYSNAREAKHNFEKAGLHDITKGVIDSFKEAIKAKNAVIKFEGKCHVTVIVSQFRQLMVNLIGNALKFSHPRRFPRIIIKCETTPGRLLNYTDLLPEINYCHLSVTDNGIGFDPQYKDRIFEVFQCLHGHGQYKGTGIGLAVCKRIVENHKGVIEATGKLNKGAQFDIYIPAS